MPSPDLDLLASGSIFIFAARNIFPRARDRETPLKLAFLVLQRPCHCGRESKKMASGKIPSFQGEKENYHPTGKVVHITSIKAHPGYECEKESLERRTTERKTEEGKKTVSGASCCIFHTESMLWGCCDGGMQGAAVQLIILIDRTIKIAFRIAEKGDGRSTPYNCRIWRSIPIFLASSFDSHCRLHHQFAGMFPLAYGNFIY